MKNRIESRILGLVIATGIASVVGQLVFLREFLSQFQGNEIVIALVMFNWLILGGIGTHLARRCRQASITVLAACSFGLVVLSVAQLAAIRFARPMMFGLGVSAGFYPIFLFSMLILAPYATLVGFVLPYSLFFLRTGDPTYPGVNLYMADNLGDVCGGALFSFGLVFWASPMQALLGANLLLIVMTARLAPRRWLGLLGGTGALAVLLAGVLTEPYGLHSGAGRLIDTKESRYGRLSVEQDKEQTTLFSDGRPIYASQDRALAEASAHYALSQVRHPRRVLLIAGVAGLLQEVCKHGVETIDYVEPDAELSRLLFQYHLLTAVPGLNLIHVDGRVWLRDTSQRYDAILVNLPEPDTLQLNRFFTERFYALVRSRLTPQGVFSFSVEGFDNYLNTAEQEKLSCLKATLAPYFRQIQVLPGRQVFFICRQTPIQLDIPALLARKGVATRYVAPYFAGDITAERLSGLAGALKPDAPLNTDVRPYLMRLVFSQWFFKFNTSPRIFIVVLTALVALYLIRLRRETFVLFTSGLMTMGSEILLIFTFQIFLGYIYAKIGIIVTAFLAGLLPGAWWGRRQTAATAFSLMVSDMILAALMIGFIACVHAFGDGLGAGFFYATGFGLSLICGFQFPVALAAVGGTNPATATVFAVDLVGAACGTLLVSTVLIPYLGLDGAAVTLMGIKIISGLVIGERYVRGRSTHLSCG